ncbi:Gfo/Idh/MocA family oxidoreductase [Mesorhizobium sp. WSM4887]|uniref:Gfo/Idh/MocA family protein n=1 Tax=Mesorhizobium sp. WSM4887 TaxID=3038543 RepID=UPI0024171F24|nr:Gfo/Idh/MocA family oxidoreductase [Mesorhizobium sp. WSM4887]MDG4889758.1 Gfo/Idh/MocA family oxidoreductase [Mesorhizobium sp. WSM4887]
MKVGIIGASFAAEAYLPALRHVADVEVTAIASARLESARSTASDFGVAHAYDDWRAMLERHKLDLVCIATPTVTHAKMTLAALDSGAHVLCEKPTAMNASEARRMLTRAEELGRVHMIDHELRFNPTRMRIAQMIAEGDLGEIRHLNIANIGSSWADPSSRSKSDWWSLASQGGGRLGANGSHQVDLVRWWLGEVASVSGEALTMVPDRKDKHTGEPWKGTADDVANFTLAMKSGARANVFISAVAAHAMGNHTQIFGSKGTITLSDGDEKLWFAKAGAPLQAVSIDDPNAGLSGINDGIWNVSVVAALRELTAAIREARPLARGATFVDGLRNQLVLDAVKTSGQERRWIDLKEADYAAA